MAKSFAASAPGRVNLIGEHTDYNGGMVLPAALSVSLRLGLTPREDRQLVLKSTEYTKPVTRHLTDVAQAVWSDAALGAIREAIALGMLTGGANITVSSAIPVGAGLSSSAALIVAVLKAARSVSNAAWTDVELALAARRVENDFLGVPCGIMDQMAVALAKPGAAMALDTKTLKYRLLPLPASHQLVVLHSGISRQLNEGRYASRKQECDIAKAHFGTQDLCLLDPEMIKTSDLAQPARSRALHCATEHARVLAAADALEAGAMTQLGSLMNESHASMRDLFDISLPKIDALVADAVAMGAIGARLTGGGFGGCIVALVDNSLREDWLAQLLAKHPSAQFIDAARGSR